MSIYSDLKCATDENEAACLEAALAIESHKDEDSYWDTIEQAEAEAEEQEYMNSLEAKSMREHIANVARIATEVRKELEAIEAIISELTDDKITVCTFSSSVDRVQFYHNGGSIAECLEALREIADDAALNVRWDDEKQICYDFTIDRMICIIIFDKEGNE